MRMGSLVWALVAIPMTVSQASEVQAIMTRVYRGDDFGDYYSDPPYPTAAAAIEALRVAGFKITSDTGAHRLRRLDGSQAQLYRADGKLDANGHLGLVTDTTFDRAAVRGLAVAQEILKDEAARLQLPRPVFGKEGSWRPTIG
jgi:hypothetical protein